MIKFHPSSNRKKLEISIFLFNLIFNANKTTAGIRDVEECFQILPTAQI